MTFFGMRKIKNKNSNNNGKNGRAMLDEDDWHQTVD